MSPSNWFRAAGLCCFVVVLASLAGWSDEAPKDKDKDAKFEDGFTNSVGVKLVRVKAGKFTMGSPRDEKDRDPFNKGSEEQHEVEITKDFYLGVTEVTQKQYKDV